MTSNEALLNLVKQAHTIFQMDGSRTNTMSRAPMYDPPRKQANQQQPTITREEVEALRRFFEEAMPIIRLCASGKGAKVDDYNAAAIIDHLPPAMWTKYQETHPVQEAAPVKANKVGGLGVPVMGKVAHEGRTLTASGDKLLAESLPMDYSKLHQDYATRCRHCGKIDPHPGLGCPHCGYRED